MLGAHAATARTNRFAMAPTVRIMPHLHWGLPLKKTKKRIYVLVKKQTTHLIVMGLTMRSILLKKNGLKLCSVC